MMNQRCEDQWRHKRPILAKMPITIFGDMARSFNQIAIFGGVYMKIYHSREMFNPWAFDKKMGKTLLRNQQALYERFKEKYGLEEEE